MYIEAFIALKNFDKIFLTGPAGCGKTYSSQKLIEKLREEGHNIMETSSTTVSARNFSDTCTTIHYALDLKIAENIEMLKHQDQKTIVKFKKYFQSLIMKISKIDYLFIDEISMISKDLLDVIFYRLKQCHFGGKIIFIGDFYQLPPVANQIRYAFESEHWENVQLISSNQNYRTDDQQYSEMLRRVRTGDHNEDDINLIKSFDKKAMLDLNDFVVITSLKRNVEKINKYFYDKLEGEGKSLKAIMVFNYDNYLTDSQAIKKAGCAEVIDIKIGSKIIFNKGGCGDVYSKGETGKIHSIEDNTIEVLLDESKEIISVIKADYILTDKKANDTVKIKQYPFICANAITIHLSQGLSIKNLYVDCKNVFANHQLYVAISRAADTSTLIIRNFRPDQIMKDEKVIDFYKENK